MSKTNHLFVVFVAWMFAAPLLGQNHDPSKAPITFEQHVRPILKVHCFQCHGEGSTVRGKLDVRLRRTLVRGGRSGAALEPGKPNDSLMLQRIVEGEMPPKKVKKRLEPHEISLLRRWIEAGAPTVRPEPESIGAGPYFTEEERSWWALQPIRRPSVPLARAAARVHTPVDVFVLARLETEGLTLAPEADKVTLIRRLYFDLLGLPPTPEAVDHFLADTAPGAYERLVDKLLASPRYGERWGRHWLDVAGYADSEGYTDNDPPRRDAYQYRDYVIRSFNADKPFDQFLQEQLAGDEMVRPPYDKLSPSDREKLIATGFLRMAPDGTGMKTDDPDLAKNQVMAETINIVSTALLGLSMGCAQCHDHRYDPILQTDYYRLRAILEPALDWRHWRTPQQREFVYFTDAERRRAEEIEREAATAERKLRAKQKEYLDLILQRELMKVPEKLRASLRIAKETPVFRRTAEQVELLRRFPSVADLGSGTLSLFLELFDGKGTGNQGSKANAELEALNAEVGRIRAKRPLGESIRALTEAPGSAPVTYVFHRGDHTQPKQAVSPGDLTILGGVSFPLKDPSLPTTGRRLAYARHLTNGKHPLTARVLVNRFWLHHFGRGLVETPADFGAQGERPTHPELLDWLAHEFMAGGWRLKRLHKLLVTSHVYRQTSRHEPQTAKIDPENRLYGRMPLRRLEAEVIRDSILTVSGQLDATMAGPPVPVRADISGQVVIGGGSPPPAAGRRRGGVMEGPTASTRPECRRSIYAQVRRSQPPALLEVFDAPLMEPNCVARNTSTVAPQALMLMNSDFILTQAESFAQRVRREVGDDPNAQIQRLWRLAYSRAPSAEELRETTAFLKRQAKRFRSKPAGADRPQMQALNCLCQVLLSSNPFLYTD